MINQKKNKLRRDKKEPSKKEKERKEKKEKGRFIPIHENHESTFE